MKKKIYIAIPDWQLDDHSFEPEELLIKCFFIPKKYIKEVKDSVVTFSDEFLEKQELYKDVFLEIDVINYKCFTSIKATKRHINSLIQKRVSRLREIQDTIRKQRAFYFKEPSITELEYRDFSGKSFGEIVDFFFEEEKEDSFLEEVLEF